VAAPFLGLSQGVRHFGVVTWVGANPKARAFQGRDRGEREVPRYERLDIARPSFLFGDRKETRSGEGRASASASSSRRPSVGPLSIYRPIEAAAVARALVNLSERPEAGVFVHHYDGLRTAG
jgi:hypothetical protein